VAVANEADRIVAEQLQQEARGPALGQIGATEVGISEHEWMVGHVECAMKVQEATRGTSQWQGRRSIDRYGFRPVSTVNHRGEMAIKIRGNDPDAIWRPEEPHDRFVQSRWT
jgi:hypothetical protein